MPEDASLDAFASSEADDGSGDAEAEPATEATEADSATETPEAVDPASSTYAWSPEGGECADCGGSVERRWRDGGELVCADCKEW